MENKNRVKNVSRAVFDLNLDFVKTGRLIRLKPDATVTLTDEELDYLEEQCPNVFKKGFLAVVGDDKKPVEQNDNVASDDDIAKIIELTIGKFRNRINKITSQDLLKDIFKALEENNKNQKYIDIVSERIKEVGDNSIVL